MNNRLIAQFNKNSVEVVKISEAMFKEKKYIDIRIWSMGGNPAEPGTEQPTKKGLCLSIDLLPELIQALKKAADLETEDQNSDEELGLKDPAF